MANLWDMHEAQSASSARSPCARKSLKVIVAISVFSLLLLSAGTAAAQGWGRCPTCRGKGTILVVKCQACGGSGRCPACNGMGFKSTASMTRNRVVCLVCRGTGQCKACNGTGGTVGKCPACGGSGRSQQAWEPEEDDNVPKPQDPKTTPPADQGGDEFDSGGNPANEGQAVKAAGFGDVIKARDDFSDKMLESNVYILSGNPRGVIAGVSASPVPDEVVMLIANADEVGNQIKTFMDRGKLPRKALITYSVQPPDSLVLFSIKEPGSAAKPASSNP